jgi:hypothetical protein
MGPRFSIVNNSALQTSPAQETLGFLVLSIRLPTYAVLSSDVGLLFRSTTGSVAEAQSSLPVSSPLWLVSGKLSPEPGGTCSLLDLLLV